MRVRSRATLVCAVAAVSLAAGACATGGGVGVPPVNQPPNAVITGGPFSGGSPLHVDFSAASSTDDGSIVDWTWNFGDGDVDEGIATQHDYDVGTWTATLLVRDDKGLTDIATVEINVTLTETDDDDDGVSVEDGDCNDSNNSIHPGAPDPFGDGIDQNCDLADGLAGDAVFVKATGGTSGPTCGATTNAPCATIAAGIASAGNQTRHNLVVAGGSYNSFNVVNGVNVQGGYDQSFVYGGTTGSKVAEVTGGDNSGLWYAIGANSVNEPTSISNLKVTPANAPIGKATYGVLVNGSTDTDLKLTSLTISGGKGGQGLTGVAGSVPGTAGSPGGRGENSRAGTTGD
ncbi:MAG TPA: PKD domain-containing protein, partial [Microthrixaceae bacterium]|nr:PKD domain-containing protein [Microthrixaceae bacterium]